MPPPEHVKKTDPKPLPEDVVTVQGIQQLPVCITDDDTVSAHSCLRKLFGRFDQIKVREAEVQAANQVLSDRRKKELSNQIRRDIAPAAFILASYLLQRGVYYFRANDADNSPLAFVKNMQDVMEAIKENQSIKDLLHPYTLEVVPGEIALQPVSVRGLPELRATIGTSAVPLDFDFHIPVYTLSKHAEYLRLARLQWAAVQIFVKWYEGRGQTEFVVLDTQQIKVHIEKIQMAISEIELYLVK